MSNLSTSKNPNNSQVAEEQQKPKSRLRGFIKNVAKLGIELRRAIRAFIKSIMRGILFIDTKDNQNSNPAQDKANHNTEVSNADNRLLNRKLSQSESYVMEQGGAQAEDDDENDKEPEENSFKKVDEEVYEKYNPDAEKMRLLNWQKGNRVLDEDPFANNNTVNPNIANHFIAGDQDSHNNPNLIRNKIFNDSNANKSNLVIKEVEEHTENSWVNKVSSPKNSTTNKQH